MEAEDKYKELLETVKWIADPFFDGGLTGEDAYNFHEEARRALRAIGEEDGP